MQPDEVPLFEVWSLTNDGDRTFRVVAPSHSSLDAVRGERLLALVLRGSLSYRRPIAPHHMFT